MARVPYVDLKDAINIRRALANSPVAAQKNSALAMYIRNESKLDARLREMAIFQVGYSARCAYEYAHHIEIGREFGVSDDDIRAIADDTAGRPTKLEPLAKSVLRAAREMTDGTAMSDAHLRGTEAASRRRAHRRSRAGDRVLQRDRAHPREPQGRSRAGVPALSPGISAAAALGDGIAATVSAALRKRHESHHACHAP